MKTYKLLLLPGDGIGPEIIGEIEKLVRFYREAGIADFATEKALIGGASYDAYGAPLTGKTLKLARDADAVLLVAVGGPKWAGVPFDKRPEAGLLGLRKALGLFANLRPAICYPALADASSLKPELVQGLDMLIVRELIGGVYFGEPKEIVTLENGEKRAVDTQLYTTHEIERIARVAFELARKRAKRVTSAEKHNAMKTGVLWKEVVTRVGADYPDIELNHIFVDNCGMQIVRRPKQFDVIVTDNLFGDILSDVAAMTTGSLGILPSASLGETDPATGKANAMYEPVHGSAPDITGKGIANPIATLSSLSMAFRYSFDLPEESDRLEKAIAGALAKGLRTADIAKPGEATVNTSQMGDAIIAALKESLA
ncbi:MAG: 3-isopropylmalate dehydrogenase [Methylobacteriaceae bacterium]|nr:3-isopropylmalate dehydrogenase [Methylobacteriaceae bacterium]